MSGAFLSWTDTAGVAQSFYFDVVLEENLDLSSQATESPVEEGVNVTDHVKKELDRVQLEVFITQEPIDDPNGLGGSIQTVTLDPPTKVVDFVPTPGAITNAIGGAIRGLLNGPTQTKRDVQVFKFSEDIDFVARTLTVLEGLRDNVTLVDVVLPSRTCPSMYLESLSLSGNADTGSGRGCKLSFKELRKVQVLIVAAPTPANVRGNTEKAKGKQGAKELSGPKKTIAKSLLDQLLGRK